jgi:hypothetical protein
VGIWTDVPIGTVVAQAAMSVENTMKYRMPSNSILVDKNATSHSSIWLTANGSLGSLAASFDHISLMAALERIAAHLIA